MIHAEKVEDYEKRVVREKNYYAYFQGDLRRTDEERKMPRGCFGGAGAGGGGYQGSKYDGCPDPGGEICFNCCLWEAWNMDRSYSLMQGGRPDWSMRPGCRQLEGFCSLEGPRHAVTAYDQFCGKFRPRD